jgi:hypothetical protein
VAVSEPARCFQCFAVLAFPTVKHTFEDCERELGLAMRDPDAVGVAQGVLRAAAVTLGRPIDHDVHRALLPFAAALARSKRDRA